MRISDWSSDECSSDLNELDRGEHDVQGHGDLGRVLLDEVGHVAERIAQVTHELVPLLGEHRGEYIPGFHDQVEGALAERLEALHQALNEQIGRASCRERVCK